jgi:hypothetical protein
MAAALVKTYREPLAAVVSSWPRTPPEHRPDAAEPAVRIDRRACDAGPLDDIASTATSHPTDTHPVDVAQALGVDLAGVSIDALTWRRRRHDYPPPDGGLHERALGRIVAMSRARSQAASVA